jgi:hypothetical protein
MQLQETIIQSTIYKSHKIATLFEDEATRDKIVKNLTKKGIDANKYLFYVLRYSQQTINLAYLIAFHNNLSKFNDLRELATNASMIRRMTPDERVDLIIKQMREVEEAFEKIVADTGLKYKL